MEILTEFDGLQEALKKVNMNEAVMPYVNGRLVDDSAWNKTQKILNCPEMISAHKYLYNLDMDQLTEDEVDKIDQLYKLGCDRGFIIDDLTDWNADEAPNDSAPASNEPVDTKPEEPVQKPIAGSMFKAKIPCWTLIYSATSKDGDIKTGEAYSNAVSAAAAKADVNAKLSRIGYSNISILAIEAANDYNCQSRGEVEENDMLNNRPHNNHVAEADEDESDDADDSDKDDDSNADSGEEEEEDDSSADDSEEDSEEEDSEEDSETDSEDDKSNDSSEEDSADDTDSEEEKDDSEEDSEEDSEKDDSEEEDSEEDSEEEDDSEDDSEDDELDANEKAELKDKYRKVFKNVLSKCKFECSFNDLTLEQKVKFFTELSKAWTKNEPTEFMTDKEVEQLNNVVVKEGSDD